MAKQSYAKGAKYTGPKAFFNSQGEEGIDLDGFYALDDDCKTLLLRGDKPVRLMHVDLAPGDDEDGSEEFVIAADGDPASQAGRLVELEPESTSAKPGVNA